MTTTGNKEIVPYQETFLERIGPTALTIPDSATSRRFFLPGDIVSSKYGVVGFVLVDSKPEKRWVTYTDGEWIGITFEEDNMAASGRNREHFLDTDAGFKMIRYFALPKSVQDFFDQDRFLGEPMINKCIQDQTLPEDYDEELADLHYAFGTNEGNGRILAANIALMANPQLKDTVPSEPSALIARGHRTYVSFHRWQKQKEVFDVGNKSIYAAIANLDAMLERFDVKRILPVRNFEIPTNPSNVILLPPPSA